MHLMLPLTKGLLSYKDRIVWPKGVSVLEGDYCIHCSYSFWIHYFTQIQSSDLPQDGSSQLHESSSGSTSTPAQDKVSLFRTGSAQSDSSGFAESIDHGEPTGDSTGHLDIIPDEGILTFYQVLTISPIICGQNLPSFAIRTVWNTCTKFHGKHL